MTARQFRYRFYTGHESIRFPLPHPVTGQLLTILSHATEEGGRPKLDRFEVLRTTAEGA